MIQIVKQAFMTRCIFIHKHVYTMLFIVWYSVVFDFKICKHELEIFLALFWVFFVVEKNYIICLVVKAMQCLFT